MLSILRKWIICVVLIPACLTAAEWDLEYWQYLNWSQWERGKWSLTTQGEVRFSRCLSRMSYYRLSEYLAYQANRYIDLQLHYSFLHFIPTGQSSFVNSNRIEFEINTNLPLKCGLKLLGRNRVELIKRQDTPKWHTVIRHRSRLIIPISGFCYLVSYNISDEVFYDANQTKFTQNRLIPFELTFKFTDTVSMNVFFMIRNNYSASRQKWYNAAVFGSFLSF